MTSIYDTSPDTTALIEVDPFPTDELTRPIGYGPNVLGGHTIVYVPADQLRRAAELGSAAVLNVGVNPGDIPVTDSMTGKIPSSVLPASVVGSVAYQGTWNADTNSPPIGSGVGVRGAYYRVSVSGATTVDGINSWQIGDWIIFNGSAWEKVDNTDTFSPAEKAKLAGIASAATANDTDANLKDRANHTGTQLLATISDAGTAAASNISPAGDAEFDQVVLGGDTRLSDSRDPNGHTHAQSDIIGLSAALDDLAAKYDAILLQLAS